MDWSQVKALDKIILNLGGRRNCHPTPGYEGHVALDLEPKTEWAVKHDLREPIPLADSSVHGIHTEDFLEHIDEAAIARVLAEAHRLLRPGGRLRVATPDYGNPKDRFCIPLGRDPRDPRHVTMTTYPLMRALVSASPFEHAEFFHYWDGDTFVQRPVDYALGMVKRTPDNDPRTWRSGIGVPIGFARDLVFRAARRFRVHPDELAVRKGHPLHVTSLIVDLIK